MNRCAWATALGGCLCALGCSEESFSAATKAAAGAPSAGASSAAGAAIGSAGDHSNAGGDDQGGESGIVMGHPRGGSTGKGGAGGTQDDGGESSAPGGGDPGASGGTGGAEVAGGGGSAGLPNGGSDGELAGTGGVADPGGSGGVAPLGGTGGSVAGTGGAPPTDCDATFAVSSTGFVRAPMKNACWHGYASAGASEGTAIPGSFDLCGAGCSLQVSGSLSASDSAYAFLGFNVNEAAGQRLALVPLGTSIRVTFTKTGTFDVRAQVSAGGTKWCATATSGTAIPWTSFKTECWGTTGTSYAMQPIDRVDLFMPGKAASATPYDVTFVSVEEM